MQDAKTKEIQVSLHVYDPVPISDLSRIGWDHIRWVAQEYKQALVKDQDTIVQRSGNYTKKMNLTNDPAAWTCWELRLKGRDCETVVVLLRRRYVPPLMDTVQDAAIIFQCKLNSASVAWPKSFLNEKQLRYLEDCCHLAADSLSCEAQNMTLYPEIIQAKLDALNFDEDGFSWINSRLRMIPHGRCDIYKCAYVFMKGILKILADENVLKRLSLKPQVEKKVEDLCGRNKRLQDMEPLDLAREMLISGERIPLMKSPTAKQNGQKTPSSEQQLINSASRHAWHMRVGRYFAYCVDGGLLGSQFTLSDIVSNLASDQITQDAEAKLQEVVAFMLHIRPKDFTIPWDHKPLKRALIRPDLLDFTFNDRVMQVLLELGYLQRLFGNDNDDPSGDYAKLLTVLLQSVESSVSLKASVCRHIIVNLTPPAKKDFEHGITVSFGLVHVMVNCGTFLATYACAALVNLSMAREAVKNYVMGQNISLICKNQLESNDDDLMLYTLMLMVHLTKSINHRAEVRSTGVVKILADMLRAFDQHLDEPMKGRIVTEICSVLGQLCNDEDTRADVCENYPVIDVLLQCFDSTKERHRIQSKVIFALKQMCVNSDDNKDAVGSRVIKAIVEQLLKIDKKKPENKDWACNAIMLLLLLSIRHNNTRLIRDSNWTETYKSLCESALGQKIDVTRDKIAQIQVRVQECHNTAKTDEPARGATRM
jgi:hypothetical protein